MEKYTVVIPTKNNVDTLRHTLATCMRQQYPNFEILVSDNCSEDGTEEMIRNLNDPRIKYIRTPKPLSMTQNFEYALSNAKEGFIMCIGADDGLMPDAIDYVNAIVDKYKVLAVSCQYAFYFWPNVPVPEHGKLILYGLDIQRNDVEIRRSDIWLHKTLAFDTALYVCELPNLYYGFVHRSVIDKCVKDGQYFRSITPDAYSAFATAISTDTYAYSLRPFSIAGISGKSNGLSQMIGGDIANRFIVENVHPIHPSFVFSPAFSVIMGEAFYQLRDAFPEKCAPYNIDLSQVIARAMKHTNEKTRSEVITAAREMADMHQIKVNQHDESFIAKMIKLLKRSFRMAGQLMSKSHWYLGIEDSEKFLVKNINEASTVLAVLVTANQANRLVTVKKRFVGRIRNRIAGNKKNVF